MSRILSKIEFAAGAILLAVITALVFAASIMRFLGNPIIWSVDLAQLLFIWLCFIGATKAMRERAHLGVDLIIRLFPHRIRLFVEAGLTVVFIVFMTLLAIEGTKLTIQNAERLFGDSGISYAFVTISVPAGCLFLTVAILINAWDAWKQRNSGKTLIYTRTELLPPQAEEN